MTKIYRVRKPCKAGYENKWCAAEYHAGGVSFWYYDTKRETLNAHPGAIEIVRASDPWAGTRRAGRAE